MISLAKETHECVQGGGDYVVCIVSLEGKRIFATEDIEYIELSPKTLASEDGVTVILDWDRNSCEAPGLGPNMDTEYGGALYLHRDGEIVHMEQEDSAGARNKITSTSLEEWSKLVSAFAANGNAHTSDKA